MQQSKKYLLLILLIAVLVFPGVVFASWWDPFSWGIWNSFFHKQPQQIVCPAIAKLCPDGSSVAPAGPKCEFPACPNPTGGWKIYTNTQYGLEVKYPGNWKYQNVSCNLDFVVFCPIKTKGKGMGGIAPGADCGITCGVSTTPTPISIYLGSNMSKSSLQYYDSQYKQIYDQMLSTFKFTK